MSTAIKVEKLQGKTKKCTICDKEKDLSLFVKRSNRSPGRQCYCKECHAKRQKDRYCSKKMRDYNLKKMYGIDLKEYDKMFKDQKGACKICKRHLSEVTNSNKRKKTLAVDHCHETNVVRGLLCDSCNRALGMFQDSTEVLESAINYLKETR